MRIPINQYKYLTRHFNAHRIFEPHINCTAGTLVVVLLRIKKISTFNISLSQKFLAKSFKIAAQTKIHIDVRRCKVRTILLKIQFFFAGTFVTSSYFLHTLHLLHLYTQTKIECKKMRK